MADASAPSAPSPDDNTNPFAFKINSKDRIGNSLFLKAIQGLDNYDKVLLSIETAQQFKEEVDRVAAQYCWGSVCSDIKDSKNNSKDLLFDYKDLTMGNVQDHANITLNCTTGDNKIAAPTTTAPLTNELKQRCIRSTMMASWTRSSLKKQDKSCLTSRSVSFSTNMKSRKQLRRTDRLC